MGLKTIVTSVVLSLPMIQAAIPSISGFKLTWGDDFAGSSNTLPSSSNWIIDTGTSYPGGPANWGTGEIQTYTSSTTNVRQDGRGNLAITALKDSKGKWTSSRIETKRTDFVCQAGKKMRIQASLELPTVRTAIGYWPAFWTLGAALRGNYTNWPGVGEFDIMENVNGANRVYGVLHCDTAPGGACNEFNGLQGSRSCPYSACNGNFHKYTFEVDRTKSLEAIRWFVDDTLFWQVTSGDIPAKVWAEAVRKPHFVLLNLAMGGSFPNAVYGGSTPLSTTTVGGTLRAEYVAVYNS